MLYKNITKVNIWEHGTKGCIQMIPLVMSGIHTLIFLNNNSATKKHIVLKIQTLSKVIFLF